MQIRDLTKTEAVVFVPLMIAIVVFGVAPALILDVVDPSTTMLVDTMFAEQ